MVAKKKSKPGPKPLPPEFKRGIRKEIQFSDLEWEAIERKSRAAGMTAAAFIRMAAISRP